MIDYHAEGEFWYRDHRPCTIHDFAHRRVLVANDHRVSDHRPEPMEEVQHFRPAHTRKQVFVAPGKPNDFVRKNRTGDDDLVIVKDPPIDIDWHIHGKQTVAEIFDLFCGNGADVFQGQWVIPLMIKKLHRSLFRAALLHRNFQSLADRLFAHWLMRTESDHDVERRSAGTDLSKQALEEYAQRTCSRSVRDD